MTDQPAAESPAVSEGPLVVRAVLRTDVGLVRSENQDFGLLTTTDEERESHPAGRLLIVADGMGGHRGGATASRLAAETVKAQYLGSETSDIRTVLRDSLTRANARIYSEAQVNPDLRGMGTTTSALVVRGHLGWFGHVGDSRIYLLRGDDLSQLTQDHSLVASMVREGLITAKEAEVHPRRNVLQRSMGVTEDVEVDISGPIRLQKGDTFIICSDGLHGVVKEDELKEIGKLSIEAAADEYVKRALDRGAPDNVTVIVARVETAEEGDYVPPDPVYDETQPLTPYDDTAPSLPVEEVDTAKAAMFDETAKIDPFDETEKIASSDMNAPEMNALDETEPLGHIAPPLPPEMATPPSAASAVTASAIAATLPEVTLSTTPLPDVTAEGAESAEPLPNIVAEPEPQPEAIVEPPAQTPTLEVASPAAAKPEEQVQPGSVSAVLKWMLIVVLVLGAAGAAFFWSQDHGGSASSSKSAPSQSKPAN